MAGDEKTNTVQLDADYSRKLQAIAERFQRSKAAQVRWWIDQGYETLERAGKLPIEATEPKLIEE